MQDGVRRLGALPGNCADCTALQPTAISTRIFSLRVGVCSNEFETPVTRDRDSTLPTNGYSAVPFGRASTHFANPQMAFGRMSQSGGGPLHLERWRRRTRP